jgi:hypothetical protein
MLFCPQCGNQVEVSDTYCRKCGTKQTPESNIEPIGSQKSSISTDENVKKKPIMANVHLTVEKTSSQISASTISASAKTFKAMGNFLKPKFLRIWLVFHIVALLLASTNADAFNDARFPKSIFWPFSGFTESVEKVDWSRGYSTPGIHLGPPTRTVEEFRGIFYGYDISEFLFYAGLGLLMAYFKNKIS